MSAAEQYLGAKWELAQCERWADLIGSRYYGGGGGYGHLVHLNLRRATIYHQPNHGDTNYHEVPAELIPDLEQAIRAKFSEILADALDRKRDKVRQAAKEALKEHEALMADAGEQP